MQSSTGNITETLRNSFGTFLLIDFNSTDKHIQPSWWWTRNFGILIDGDRRWYIYFWSTFWERRSNIGLILLNRGRVTLLESAIQECHLYCDLMTAEFQHRLIFPTHSNSKETLSIHVFSGGARLRTHLHPPLNGSVFEDNPKKCCFCSYFPMLLFPIFGGVQVQNNRIIQTLVWMDEWLDYYKPEKWTMLPEHFPCSYRQ